MSATQLPLPGDPDALWILDLSSWIRGLWELIKPPANDLADRTVVLATVRRLVGLLGTERPARLVAAVDSRLPPWQAALWPSYKAGRPQPGPGYFEQLRVVREVLTRVRASIGDSMALGIRVGAEEARDNGPRRNAERVQGRRIRVHCAFAPAPSVAMLPSRCSPPTR